MKAEELTEIARRAVVANDWSRVGQCAIELARRDPQDAEAPYLMGLSQKALRNVERAEGFFRRAIELDSGRYDAAIELASQLISVNRYREAREILAKFSDVLPDDAEYIDMAGHAYFVMGLYERAWQLFERCVALQPNNEGFLVHKAACAVFLGDPGMAGRIYRKILKRNPGNRRIHYELAQLERARNDAHIKQMLKVVRKGTPSDNIFLYYALGKEYEDLGQWKKAFEFFERGGNAVKSVMNYDVREDVEIMDKLAATCTASWLADDPASQATRKTPVFIVGLPRTGTTLTDRILSSHSEVQSAGESQLLQMVLRDGTRAGNNVGISVSQIEAAAQRDPSSIAAAYMSAIQHRLDDEPYFIEKLPENVLYLGFIAKSWPNARLVHLRRHPMDACFAMYKQSYFRFAYALDDLAEYYLAYDRLVKHWRDVLGQRLVEIEYENLVTDQEGATRKLLSDLGLQFEDACLRFDANTAPVATASSVQVREKVHTRSVGKWQKFASELDPLRQRLEAGGVRV